LGETFGIVYNAHNALDDAKTCGDITLLAAEKLGSKTLKELLEKTRIAPRNITGYP
jgi:DNA polymerase-3 subunit epsilon